MKKLSSTYKFIVLAVAILFSINEIKAQCDIHISDEIIMPVCYGEMVDMWITSYLSDSIVWKHNDTYLDEGQSISVAIKGEEPYNTYAVSVHVYDRATHSEICSSDRTFTSKPKINITFEQLRLTCSNSSNDNGQTGQVKAIASGGGSSSYVYHWNPPINEYLLVDPQIAVSLCAYTDYSITVENDGCFQTDTVRLKAHLNPNIELSSDPADTVFLDNPFVTWSFKNKRHEDPDTIIDYDAATISWKFNGYSENTHIANPSVTYTSTGDGIARLTVVSEQGCDTTYTSSITVAPVKLKIPNIFTPNGDGTNDYFEIGCLDQNGKVMPLNDLNKYFLSHKLVVFNRWGRIVYESNDYQNDWDGGNLPDGTYFYVLTCKGETQDYSYKGSVMIWNSNR